MPLRGNPSARFAAPECAPCCFPIRVDRGMIHLAQSDGLIFLFLFHSTGKRTMIDRPADERFRLISSALYRVNARC